MKKIINALREFFKALDISLLLICIACSAISLICMWSLYTTEIITMGVFITQSIGVILGITIALILSAFDYEFLAKLWKIHAPLTLFLVILTFTPLGIAATELADDKAWLSIFGVSLQPSELLKISFILTFALHLHYVGKNINRLKPFALLCLHGAVPTLLIMLQGDFGSALIFLFIFISMMFFAGLSIRWIVVGIVGIIAMAPIVWMFVLPEYLKERFYVAFHPENYLDGAGRGWQQYLGRISIGSGGLVGRGIANDGLYNNVPEVHNDFIFTYIGQVLGFVGCTVVLLLLLLLCIRILIVSRMSNDVLGNLICVGVFTLFFVQTIINIGMVLCALPVIGITLPFFSAGGTSIVTSYISVGLVFSVYRKNKHKLLFD